MSTTTQGFIGLRHQTSAVAKDNLAVGGRFLRVGLVGIVLLYDPFPVAS
jgi:hypothetical protein